MRSMGILVAALALAACATAETETAQASGERDCFNSDSIHGYSVVDDHTVAVRVGANRSYLLRTSWNARDLDWTQRIAIRSTTGWICTGNGLGVDVIGGTPQRTYPVMEIARAPEEPAQQGS